MASVNISLTEEAYRYLKILKGKEKSFSDVILEIRNREAEKGTGRSLLKFAGVLRDVDWDERKKKMEEFRKSFNRHAEKTRKYMKDLK